MVREWRRDAYTISTDKRRVDVDMVHDFLANRSYWARGIPRAVLERSIEHSHVFGVYEADAQVGFARVITDFAVFGWLADVFVVERARGCGVGTWLMETIMACPELQGFRRWGLGTNDAHELYRRVGFRELERPDRLMELVHPDPYGRGAA
jgi:N-acetylglutamate synthase-like GNAT family acetyltransferase